MKNKDQYLDWLKVQIEHVHRCTAYFLRTETVHETAEGKTVWLGDVEVFGLIGHPEAKQCFAWAHDTGTTAPTKSQAIVLAIPPVVTATNAVRLHLAKHAKS